MYYFASDIHLGAGDEASAACRERRFVQWLDRAARDAQAVVLAGDIFDFWFEYRRVVPKGFVRTLGKLAELSDRGIRIVFFTGNHDMWVGDYLARECGAEVHTRPALLTLGRMRVFVAHGDNLNIQGRPGLRLLNAGFRSRVLRWFFSWGLHPDWAVRFGRWWSGKSRAARESTEGKEASVTDPLIEYARTYAETAEVDLFVFGHMHFPRDYSEEGLHVICLGGWADAPTYAATDGCGRATLETFEPEV